MSKKSSWKPRHAEEIAEQLAENHGFHPVSDGEFDDLRHTLDILSSLHELERIPKKPFQSYEGRERVDRWAKDGRIIVSYAAHAHVIIITIRGTEIRFQEAFEHFPSEYMLANIALALEAGVE